MVSLKEAKAVISIVFGFTVLAIGIVFLVTPGPGILVVILGLTILAGHFIWAKHLLRKIKEQAGKAKKKLIG